MLNSHILGEDNHPHSTRHWYWQLPDWLATPRIPEQLLRQGQRIDSLSRRLDKLASRFPDDYSRMLARELEASFAIENESLDILHLTNAARGCKQDNNYDDDHDAPREYAIVDAVTRFLGQTGAMTAGAICRLHSELAPAVARARAGMPRDSLWGWHQDNHGPSGEIDVEKAGKPRKTSVSVYGLRDFVFVPPPPSSIDKYLEQYCQWWNNESHKLPGPLRASLAMFFLACIHPFCYGNGVISRLMGLKMLSLPQRPWRPYNVAGAVLRTQQGYYAKLRAVDSPGNLFSLLSYLLDIHEMVVHAAIDFGAGLERYEDFASRFGDRFAPAEKTLLRILATDQNHRWSFWEATREDTDTQALDAAWRGLVEQGLICNGHLDLEKIGEKLCQG